MSVPQPLFQTSTPEVPGWAYDVAADGRRFLALVRNEDAAPVTVVVNWLAEMNK